MDPPQSPPALVRCDIAGRTARPTRGPTSITARARSLRHRGPDGPPYTWTHLNHRPRSFVATSRAGRPALHADPPQSQPALVRCDGHMRQADQNQVRLNPSVAAAYVRGENRGISTGPDNPVISWEVVALPCEELSNGPHRSPEDARLQ